MKEDLQSIKALSLLLVLTITLKITTNCFIIGNLNGQRTLRLSKKCKIATLTSMSTMKMS